MKRPWGSISSKIEAMIAAKRQNTRIKVYSKCLLHATIWKHFNSTDRMDEELHKQLLFHCNDLVTLQKPDIASFQRVNQLLMNLFHSPRMVKPGFKILQDRIRELRKTELERNKTIQRNYLLQDKRRGGEQESETMMRVYQLPPELFNVLVAYL